MSSSVSAPSLLLQTKLHRPRLPKDLITRTRLLELLNHDINHQLILVTAPAKLRMDRIRRRDGLTEEEIAKISEEPDESVESDEPDTTLDETSEDKEPEVEATHDVTEAALNAMSQAVNNRSSDKKGPQHISSEQRGKIESRLESLARMYETKRTKQPQEEDEIEANNEDEEVDND